MRYLEKYMQDLFTKNYNTLLREIRENQNKWRDTPCSWIRSLNIVKTSILPKLIYRCSAISNKVSAGLVVETDTVILKFMYKCKNLE